MGPLFIVIALSAFWLWVTLFIVSACIVAALENDAPGWATFSVAATFAVLWFFTDFSLRYDLRGTFSWKIAIALVIGYVVCGIIWSFIKWYVELTNRRDRYEDAIQEYIKSSGNKRQLTKHQELKDDEHYVNWMAHNHPEFIVNDPGYSGKKIIKVRPEPNRSRIIAMMVYWPWSLLWSIFDDLITGVFKFIYRRLVGGYKMMANHVFAGYE